ncbi:MAG: bifunctional riboflavin kinase/FAD synthetase [Hyphomicrobiales bacterium]
MPMPDINDDFLTLDNGAAFPDSRKGGLVVIGNFDGVHAGHRVVLQHALGLSAGALPVFALTFEPHPRTVFQPENPVFRLSPVAEKAALLKACGLSGVVNWPFTHSFASLSAEEFVDNILLGYFGVSHVVVGYDFHFGKGREGSPSFLLEAGKARGFGVTVVPRVNLPDGLAVSSSAIREHLAAGSISAANTELGYRWFVSAEVVHGEKRGRELGYPTANMQLSSATELAHGIYAVSIRRADGTLYNGVASYGRRPQFDNGAPLLESFLFGFSQDLYGETLTITFHEYLRGEARFESVEQLVAQMDNDSKQARDILQRAKPLSELDARLSF